VKRLVLIAVGGLMVSVPSTVGAQRPLNRADTESRYQIGQMERVLEGAVEHGATVTRDRLKAVLPPADTADTLMSGENARARGFRLEGYGVFFDVSVPSFETTWWTMRTLDQNDLGYDSAMKQLQQVVKGNANAEQALKRVELQVDPRLRQVPAATQTGVRTETGSTASASQDAAPAPRSTADPILTDPNEVYRTEVMSALEDAMLEHSGSLGLDADEWLTVAARGNDDRPRLAPADSSSRTRIIRLRGSDLAAFLARQITKEEAKARIEVRIY
jgi:hypothetical protein